MSKISVIQSSKFDKRKKFVITFESFSQSSLNTFQKNFINDNDHLLNDAINVEEYDEIYKKINRDDSFANQRRTAFVNKKINVEINYIKKILKMNCNEQDMQDTFKRFSTINKCFFIIFKFRNQTFSQFVEFQNQSQIK